MPIEYRPSAPDPYLLTGLVDGDAGQPIEPAVTGMRAMDYEPCFDSYENLQSLYS